MQPSIPFDLKCWKKERKIKSVELARILGVSPPQIWRLQTAGKVPMLYIWALRGYDAYKTAREVRNGTAA